MTRAGAALVRRHSQMHAQAMTLTFEIPQLPPGRPTQSHRDHVGRRSHRPFREFRRQRLPDLLPAQFQPVFLAEEPASFQRDHLELS